MTHKTLNRAACFVLMVAIAFTGYFAPHCPADSPKDKENPPMIEWGPERNGVRCAAVLKSNERKVYADEPIRLLLLTKNVGAKDVLVVTEGSVLFVYAIKVVGPDGKPTPLTSYGQKAKKWAGSGSAATDKLGPGQEDTSDLLLGRIFDMTREGEYKISFSQSIWPARGMPPVDVSSNVLIITVLGEKAEYAPSK